jgi:protein O-mannosyl-transferase
MRLFRATYLYAVLLALTFVAYLPVWDNGYVDFDDEEYITANPEVTSGFTMSGFRWVWTADRTPYRAPLTWLSFQLDAHCFAVRTPEGETVLPPAAVHGQNLFWHAASVLLLFGFGQRVTGRRWPSFVVAALFAVHPMHVESVAWAAERKDVLSGFFGLLTLGAYFHYLKRPGWLRYGVLTLAYALSLMSKPMLLTLPFVLLLLDYWPLRRLRGTHSAPGAAKGTRLSQLILEKLPLFLLSALVAIITLEARESHSSIVDLNMLSFSARLANALTAYGWYLCSTFCPLRLAVLYPHPYERWSVLSALAGGTMLLSLTLLSWWQANRRPWLLVGWLWFVGGLLPVIGFAQGGRQSWADRFSYWPHIGLFIALVWGLAELIERFRLPVLVPRLAGVVVLGWFALLTWGQVGSWVDSRTLWEQALIATQDNDYAHEHLARYYHSQGQVAEAESHLLEAVRIQRRRNSRP